VNFVEPASSAILPEGISVIIPVYNSEAILGSLVSRLEPVLSQASDRFELVLVNDGSLDGSWNEIIRLAQEHLWIRGICFMRNYGQHNALLGGLRAARYATTVTMDDDLQHPPEEIPVLLETLARGYDVVYGTPVRQQHGLWRNFASYFTRLALQGTMGIENARKVSAFRAFATRLRDAFPHYQSPNVILDVLLSWGTSNFGTVATRHEPRASGKSNYSLSRLILHAINMLTGFSVLPLQLASLMGFVFAFFGLMVLVYVIGRFVVQGGSVPGFPFLASIIAIFSGVQLFALGIIGEYIARIHFRIMERPAYLIRQDTGEKL
jgi:glycosyltransferase involved in cell wall biosynthesis